MKCDACNNEATVHEVTVKGGKRSEKHLCESCAREAGMSPQVVVHQPITQLLSQYITAPADTATPAAAPQGTAAATSCPACEMSFSSFRSTGLLGCPTCYEVFKLQLTPVLARAHEGGTHHAGKRPRGPRAGRAGGTDLQAARATGEAEAFARLQSLRRTLEEAVGAEKYELAAKLRDELATLERAIAEAQNPPRRAARGRADRDGRGQGESGA